MEIAVRRNPWTSEFQMMGVSRFDYLIILIVKAHQSICREHFVPFFQ